MGLIPKVSYKSLKKKKKCSDGDFKKWAKIGNYGNLPHLAVE